MDNEGIMNRITLNELAELTGYNEKLIIRYVNQKLLLPAFEYKEYLGRGKGNKTYYPIENLKRLQVFRWYNDYFQKQPGKVGGLDFLFHLLFVFGFKSPEIYQAEKRMMSASSALITKICEQEVYDGALIYLELEKIFSEGKIFLPLIQYLVKLRNNSRGNLELISVLNDSMSRQCLDVHEVFIYSLPFYIEFVSKLNIEALLRVQEGICFLISGAAGLLNEDIVRDKYAFFNESEFSVTEVREQLEKLLSLLTEQSFKDKKEMLSFFLNPQHAFSFYIIFMVLRETDDKNKNVRLSFTEEEIDHIPNVNSGRHFGKITKV